MRNRLPFNDEASSRSSSSSSEDDDDDDKELSVWPCSIQFGSAFPSFRSATRSVLLVILLFFFS